MLTQTAKYQFTASWNRLRNRKIELAAFAAARPLPEDSDGVHILSCPILLLRRHTNALTGPVFADTVGNKGEVIFYLPLKVFYAIKQPGRLAWYRLSVIHRF